MWCIRLQKTICPRPRVPLHVGVPRYLPPSDKGRPWGTYVLLGPRQPSPMVSGPRLRWSLTLWLKFGREIQLEFVHLFRQRLGLRPPGRCVRNEALTSDLECALTSFGVPRQARCDCSASALEVREESVENFVFGFAPVFAASANTRQPATQCF